MNAELVYQLWSDEGFGGWTDTDKATYCWWLDSKNPPRMRKLYTAPVAAQAQPYSLNLDPAGIRALAADAITGALALGAQGAEQPPADHWLKPFYEMGLQSAVEEKTVVPAVAQKFAERLSAALKSLDRQHFNGVNVQLAIRDVVHSFTRLGASDVAAMAQPERHAENTETVVCGCGDLYPTGSYGAGFIAAAGHCENCDAAKGTDVDKADALPPLNNELIEILGRPNFQCIQVANALRSGGQEIANRAENEQAAVIHFLLGHYLADPNQWAENASAAIDAARKEQA